MTRPKAGNDSSVQNSMVSGKHLVKKVFYLYSRMCIDSQKTIKVLPLMHYQVVDVLLDLSS